MRLYCYLFCLTIFLWIFKLEGLEKSPSVAEARAQSPKCRKPKGKVGTTYAKGCSVFVCRKVGRKKAKWIETFNRCCTFEDNTFLIGQNITTFFKDECSIGTLHCEKKDEKAKVGLSVDMRCCAPEESPSIASTTTPGPTTENCGMVIYGGSYADVDGPIGPLVFIASNVVTNEKELWYDVANFDAVPTYSNYWITEDGKKGADAQLHMSFACTQTITGFQLKNTHNFSFNDRGTENFSIWIWKSEEWTKVQTGTLNDTRNLSPVPLTTFNLRSPVRTEKVIFQIDSYYGKGGGLQYFSIY